MTGARASTVTTTQQDLAAALSQESRDLQVLCSGTGKGLRGLETVRSWDPCVWVLLAGCQQGYWRNPDSLHCLRVFIFTVLNGVFHFPWTKGRLITLGIQARARKTENLNRSAWPKLLKTCASFMTEGSAV